MVEDLEAMTREQLIVEARRLRAGIRTHRDSTGHALCWHHPALWRLLPEKTDPLPSPAPLQQTGGTRSSSLTFHSTCGAHRWPGASSRATTRG